MEMANSLINAGKLAADNQNKSFKIFGKTVEWEGVRVGHYRVRPGELSKRIQQTHHVFVPLVGSVTIEGEMNGTTMISRPGAGQISVTPAGVSYSASWQKELEYVMVYFSQEYISRATVDFKANKAAKLLPACGPQDPL